MKIRIRFVIALLLIALTSIIIVGAFSYQFAKLELINTRGQQLQAIVSGKKGNLEHVLIAWKDRVNLISSRTQLRKSLASHLARPAPAHTDRMLKILQDAAASVRAVQTINICDNNGKLIISVGDPTLLYSGACSDYLSKSNDKTQLRRVWRDDAEDGLHIMITGPIILEGQLLSTIQVVLNARELLQITGDFQGLGDTGETLIARRDKYGNALFITPTRFGNKADLDILVPVQRENISITHAVRGEEKFIYDPDLVDYQGNPVLAATAFLPETGWGIVSKIDRTEALQPVTSLLINIVRIAVIASLLALLAGIFLSRSLTQPIHRLVKATQKLGMGDLSQSVEVNRHDEIGQLAVSFNQMVESLANKTETLRESEERFRIAVDNAPIGIALVAPDGKWLSVNQAICKMLGYSEQELLAMNFQAITHPDDLDTDLIQVQKILNGEIDSYELEKRYYHKDGTLLWGILSVGIVRDENGEPLHFVSQIMDITERKKTLHDLENANLELEEFAYRTSHDLRSPILSSIKLLDVASGCIARNQEEQAQTCLTHTKTSLKHLETLIEDILTLTRTKNSEEQTAIVDVSFIVEQTLKNLTHMEDFDRLDIRKELRFNEPLMVKKSRLEMILGNLLSNAVKYQDPENDTPYVRVKTYSDNRNFVLEVSDNGMGIPEDQQDNVFTMFKRFHPRTSYGSGLGLYLTKKSADVLNGEITYHRQPESGSIFRLRIPLMQVEEKQ